MSGAINVGAHFGRVRRHVHSVSVDDTDLAPNMHIITPLHIFKSKHRACKSLTPFFSLPANCREDFYDKIADYYTGNGGEILAYFSAAESVACQFGLY